MEKKMNGKRGILVSLISIIMLFNVMTVMAAEWKQDEKGWWYQHNDGSYSANTWEWIDGNMDGIAECYYFDNAGYMLSGTVTPDGFHVNESGAWILDGVVQVRGMKSENGGDGGKNKGDSYNKVVGGNQNVENSDSQYIIRRIGIRMSNDVQGGRIVKYNDYSDMKSFTQEEFDRYMQRKNYDVDGELFFPEEIDDPSCVVIEVEIKDNVIIKATPVWIDNGEWNYGGFSGYGEKGEYIRGRLEWREFEDSDPSYAEQLKLELTAAAKQRAFEVYPDMIVDYSNN